MQLGLSKGGDISALQLHYTSVFEVCQRKILKNIKIFGGLAHFVEKGWVRACFLCKITFTSYHDFPTFY